MENKESINFQELYARRDECTGFKFVNLQHQRTFTYNIFELNTRELFDIAEIICDPDGGLYLISTENKEAGRQAHREINRRMHNFVASAKSLVDHTRVFMNKNYKNSTILEEYNKKISKELSSNPIVQFIHDIRNYILHKELPPSRMFFEAKPANDGSGHIFSTGVYFDVNDLLSWNKWNTHSLNYIKKHNDKIHIKDVCSKYRDIISNFHSWLNKKQFDFHVTDIEELAKIENQIALLDRDNIGNKHFSSNHSLDRTDTAEQGSNLSVKKYTLDKFSLEILNCIFEIEHTPDPKSEFPSERSVSATLTDDRMLGTPQVWCFDKSGQKVFAFIYHKEKSYGLTEEDFSRITKTSSEFIKENDLASKVSQAFLQSSIISWLGKRFTNETSQSLSEAIEEQVEKNVQALEIILPIAELEIQTPFTFGVVEIIPLSSEKFDQIERLGANAPDGQKKDIATLFGDMRQEMQGLAAVSVMVTAESEFAMQIVQNLAQSALGLLRFFSPAASNPWLINSMDLLGSKSLPSTNIIAIGDDSFNFTRSADLNNVVH